MANAASTAAPDPLGDALRRAVRGDVLTDRFSLAAYATAACIYRIVPRAVVVPKDAADVAASVRVAAGAGVPVTPRGAGSGLCGQALGPGVVLDFTKYMDRVLEIDASARTLRVQPGAVTGKVNEALAPHGLMLGPDPSSEPFSTIGGNLGNNASGARGIRYGSMKDYVEWLDVVLSDGSPARLEALEEGGEAAARLESRGDLLGRIAAGTRRLVTEHAALIARYRPHTGKNSAGYNVFEVRRDGLLDLTRLVVGSEGTLAVIVEAGLRAVAKPRERASLLLWFSSLEQAGEAVRPILDLGPSACEIMERHFLDIVRADGSVPSKYLPEKADTVLLVEQLADSRAENEAFLARVRRRIMDERGLAFGGLEAYDPDEQERLWRVRKRAVQILQRLPGPRRITPFVEDVTVPPDRLVEYIRGLYEIWRRYGVEAAIYGHAGDSNLHARPLLDTRVAEDVAKMKGIAADVARLTVGLGGTISCEHGDGLARSGYLPLQFGDLYGVLGEVKRLWDPAGVLNPGKIVTDEREVHLADLRMGPDFRLHAIGADLDRDPWAAELVRCHGCGTCRAYCPVYKVTGDETASPRGHASLLREVLSGGLDLADLNDEKMRAIADLCYNCKTCLVECPSNVKVAGLVLKHKAHLARQGYLGLRERLVLKVRPMGRAGSALAPVANWLLSRRPVRFLMEKVGGIGRRAAMPRFDHDRLAEGVETGAAAPPRPPAKKTPGVVSAQHPSGPSGKRHLVSFSRPVQAASRVAYFAGCFELFNEPHVGRAAVRVLEALGCRVLVPEQRCCGIPKISAGDAAGAVADMRANLDILAPLVQAGWTVTSGCPSCLLTLVEDYPDMAVEDDRARRVAAAVRDVHVLIEELAAGEGARALFGAAAAPWRGKRLAYHAPCHLRAAGRGLQPKRLLERLLGIEFAAVTDTCCGMGGTFGLKARHADLSRAIAEPVLEKVRAAGAEAVVTSCGMCRTQLAHGTGLPAYHPLELLAGALAPKGAETAAL